MLTLKTIQFTDRNADIFDKIMLSSKQFYNLNNKRLTKIQNMKQFITPQTKTQSNILSQLELPQLNPIINELTQVNQAYIKSFNNYQFKSDLISRKHTVYLYNKICGELEQGHTQLRNYKKQKLCRVFRSFIVEFLNVYIVSPLSLCSNDNDITMCLIERWENFKRFCYFYFFLLKVADVHYQSSFKSYKGRGRSNKIESQDSIFPLSAIAIYYFEMLVFRKFKTQILRIIRHMLGEQRQAKFIQRQQLRSLIEIVYSSGLSEVARINSIKRQNNQYLFYFYTTRNRQFLQYYTNITKNPDENFFRNILNDIIEDSSCYYFKQFNQKIISLGPHQDFSTVSNILQKQQELSEYYFFNKLQMNSYLNKIKQILVMTKLQQRLCRENSLKYCLERFDHNFEEYISQIKLIIDTLFKAKGKSIKILQNVVRDYLLESGQKINQKLNKRKQHIMQIVNLKKSINKLIDQVMHKDLNICIVRDKCFRKLLDTIEASRNLSDFIDFKIKQCIKNKLGDSETAEKIKDVFLVLQNLAATDSFLMYHQEMLGRRLLQPLNEPKIQIQKLILKKISQKLGAVTVNVHSFMIKDLEKSQEISQNFTKKLPFSRFKLSCRIISPQFWPQTINNNPIEMILPEAVRLQAESIRQLYHQQYSKFLIWKIQKGYSLFEGSFKSGKFRFQAENIFVMLLFHIIEAKNHQIYFWELLQKITKMKQGNSYIMKCIKALVDNNLLLRANPDNQQPITETQVLKINAQYKPAPGHKPNQTIMIKITSQMQKALHETTVQHNKILKEREKLIQAVIVKILKHSHSTGTNRTTLEEIVKGVREYQHLKNFQIPQNIIKQRLQEVIARGFCQRDQTNRKIYQYIA